MIVAGILTPIENVLTSALEWLHSAMGLPWAWAIVVLTLCVRMLLVPLTVRQIHSMQNLQKHAPEMKAIQERYKNDKVKQREELMAFYKENSINPAASCLPILPQIPIFISLYFVLTGVHALHMVIGLGLLTFLVLRARRAAFDAGWSTPVELVGLYWHFVDIVWIFLFPLLYLIGRH